MYTVVDAAGNAYGPVSLEELTKWHNEGRVAPTSFIQDTTGARTPAAQFFGQQAPAPPQPTAAAPFGQAPPQAPQGGPQPFQNHGLPTGDQMSGYFRPSNYAGEADLGKRFIGILIDAVPAIIVNFVLASMFRPSVSISAGAGGLNISGGYGYPYYLLSGLVLGGYFLIRDCLAGPGQSFGKKLAGTRCVTESGAPFTIQDSIKRNLPSSLGSLLQIIPGLNLIALPIVGVVGLVELILIIVTKQRIGDKLFNYHVVNA